MTTCLDVRDRATPSGVRWQQDHGDSSAEAYGLHKAVGLATAFYGAPHRQLPPLGRSWPLRDLTKESNQAPVFRSGRQKRHCRARLIDGLLDQVAATGPGGCWAIQPTESRSRRTHCRKVLQLGIEGFDRGLVLPLR